MKVLHISSGHMYGGIERTLTTLCKHRASCAQLDHHVAFCFDARPASEIRTTGTPVHLLGSVRFSRPWTVWAARRNLMKLLKSGDFDVVICHAAWPHALFASVVRRAKIALVMWAHDTLAGDHWTERRAARVPPDLILVNSQTTRKTVEPLFPGVPQPVLYYPVEAGPVVTEQDRATIRASLATPDKSTVIVTACRLESWKGHRLLIDALGHLRGRADWTAWIIGGPQRDHEKTYLAELQQQAERLGIFDRIRFAGQRDDVPRLLASADVHCQPNTGPEPFGVAFVEALYAGLPVVTTAMGGPLEIVDASCGVLVEPDRPDALAKQLDRLLDDPAARRALGRAGPARATRLCDPPVALALLYDALQQAVSTHAAPDVVKGRLQPC